MLVSNNNLLNILLPKENKVLKEALKDADAKTFTNLKSGNTTVGDILKNLFTDLKTGNKSNASIENMLKNSNLFKDLGNFSKSLTTLLNQLDADSNLNKYKPILQSFLKDISTLDEKSLKDMISKSGIFLESKALSELTKGSNLPKNIETLLLQIKTILKDIPSLEAKKIESLIEKILQNSTKTSGQSEVNQGKAQQTNQEIKSLIPMLQNLARNLGDKQLANLTMLTNNLKDISNEAQLVESKLSNQKDSKVGKQALLQENNIKSSNIVNTNQSTQQTNLQQAKENIITNTKEILTQLKTQILTAKNIPDSSNLLKQIDSLLQASNLFNKNETTIEPKNLINQLINLPQIKTASNQNNNISNILSSLKNQVETIEQLETKVLQNQNIQGEKQKVTQDINQALNSLKNEFLNIKGADTKLVNQIIDKLLNLQNIFNKVDIPMDLKTFQQNILNQNSNLNSFQSNFSSNINNIILNLKEAIFNLGSKQENTFTLQQNIIKTVEKLENNINTFLQMPSSLKAENKAILSPLQNDMKTVLLQIKEELSSKTDIKSVDTLKQVDKMVSQIEYYQLLSLSSNSNSVYIPFLWDMLDEGSISMKKLEEEKFYCEINLSLKEFGQTQLMLALYDKNKLDLTIYASQDSFKQAIKENSSKLKQGLNQAGLIPVNINIIDLKKEEEISETKTKNAYTQDPNLGLGLNIRV